MAPMKMCYSTGAPILYSDNVAGQWAGTTFPIATATGVVSANSNSTFTTTSAVNGGGLALFRLLVAGLRVKCTSAEQTLGGWLLGTTNRDHAAFSSTTPTLAQNDPRVHKLTLKKQGWTNIVWVPQDGNEMQYTYYSGAIPGSAGNVVSAANNFSMGFWVNSYAAATVQQMEFEAYAHFEVIADGVSYSPNMPDTDGADAVFYALTNATTSTMSVYQNRVLHKDAEFLLCHKSGIVMVP